MDLSFLWAYPIATISSLAFYAVMVALAVPSSRGVIGPWLVHPVAPHQQYLQAFDTFRGFAAILVAIGHCWWASYPVFARTQFEIGFLAYDSKAVPIFAVLSGFLIYRSVLTIKSLDDLRSYVVRRFFRIYPVYLLSVVLCLICGQYVAGEYFSRSGFFVSDLFMFYVINWPAGFANPVAWSLYVEVAFYAFLPLAVLALGRRRVVPFAIIGILAMIVAEYPSRVFGLWKFFLMGILASEFAWAEVLDYEPLPRIKLGVCSFVIGLALLIYDFGGPERDWVAHLGISTHRGDNETLALGLGCFLVLAALPHVPTLSKALDVLPLRLLGLISYSLYVTHFFYILANFPELGLFTHAGTPPMYAHFQTLPLMAWWYLPLIFFPGCLTWALISFLLVERPGIQLGRRLLGRRSERTVPLPEPQRAPQLAE